MKLSVFCGASVDGFLARPDDRFDFLKTGEQEPHGFAEFLASVDVIVIGRRTFEVVLKLGHLALYGNKPVVVLSSRPLDFSAVKGRPVEQMLGEPAENRKAAQLTRLQACVRRWRHHNSAIPCGRTPRPVSDHTRARTDRVRHPVVRLRAARHQPSPRRDALL
jgi:hypothetical protein